MTLEGMVDQMEKQKKLDHELKGKKVGILNSFIMRNQLALNHLKYQNEKAIVDGEESDSDSIDGEDKDGSEENYSPNYQGLDKLNNISQTHIVDDITKHSKNSPLKLA